MKIDRPSHGVFKLTLHAYELSSLIAAARWAAEGAEGEMTEEAREHLQTVLESFDAACREPGPDDRADGKSAPR
jgi:hypothetical protein